MKGVVITIIAIIIGAAAIFFFMGKESAITTVFNPYKPTIIGFLPYWLTSKKDYSPYVDTIAYFGVIVGPDGTIVKENNPGELEPGWYALQNGKAFQASPRPKTLVVFSGDQEAINQLVDNPETHALALMQEVKPLMKNYGFTDLNIDIESVSIASESARQNFTTFLKTVHDELKKQNPTTTLSVDVSPTALIQPYLIDVAAIAPYVNHVVFMTYDFHYQGSSVTGAVSPLNGAGITAEYDVETSIQQALRILPKEKIIMGVPLYGYEWETLSDTPRASVIPGTGITASNKRVEELLDSCATCSARFDDESKEAYVIYHDPATNTYHQIFYTDKRAMEEKVKLMKKYQLAGMALWALGYEGNSVLTPLRR